MQPIILPDKPLNTNFDISLAYRYSAKYEEGLQQKIEINNYNVYPINLTGFTQQSSLAGKVVRKLSSIFEVFLMILDIKVLSTHFKIVQPEVLIINNGGYPGARTCRSAAIAAGIAKVENIYFSVNNVAVPYAFLYSTTILILVTVLDAV